MKNLIAFIYGQESLLQHTQLSFNEKQSLTTMGGEKNMLHCLALDSYPLNFFPPFCQVTNKLQSISFRCIHKDTGEHIFQGFQHIQRQNSNYSGKPKASQRLQHLQHTLERMEFNIFQSIWKMLSVAEKLHMTIKTAFALRNKVVAEAWWG